LLIVQIKVCWHKKTRLKMLNLPRKTAIFCPGGSKTAGFLGSDRAAEAVCPAAPGFQFAD
jgi:hypothetical protein